MELWIKNSEIAERVSSVVLQFDLEKQALYKSSKFSDIFKDVDNLTHKDVIEFCELFCVNYKYVMLGIGPVCDVDDTNRLYSVLIDKQDFTI